MKFVFFALLLLDVLGGGREVLLIVALGLGRAVVATAGVCYGGMVCPLMSMIAQSSAVHHPEHPTQFLGNQ